MLIKTDMMILQYAAASRVMASQMLASPASVLSIPNSGHQEDYVSNGANGAWRLHKVTGNVQTALALELIAACQAVSISSRKLPVELREMGRGTRLVLDCVRKKVPFLEGDRYLSADIDQGRRMIRSMELLQALISGR